jgi:tetratricopeptide (TPR) repeat protein
MRLIDAHNRPHYLAVSLAVVAIMVINANPSSAWAENKPATPPKPVPVAVKVAPKPVAVTKPVTTAQVTTKPAAQPTTPAATTGHSTDFKFSTETDALKITDDIAIAQEQVNQHPDDPEAHFILASALSRSPYLERAFAEIKQVKELLKARQDFSFIDETITQYEALHNNEPHNTLITYRLAMGYFFKGYLVEKYPHHMAAIKHEGAPVYYDKAKGFIQQVIASNPDDYFSYNYLGYLTLEGDKNMEEAVRLGEASLNINKTNNPGAYLLMAKAYSTKGDIQKTLFYGARGLQLLNSLGYKKP